MAGLAASAAASDLAAGGIGSIVIRSAKPVIDRLRKRPEFVRLRDGARYRTAAFLLQAKPRPDDGANTAPRFGYTVTKKTGNAVERNRIRRRLREAVRRINSKYLRPCTDYVLIGNRPALNETMESMVAELARGLEQVNRKFTQAGQSDGRSGKRQDRRQAARRSKSGTSV